jgi:ATP-dependent protease ClpP protease subunit
MQGTEITIEGVIEDRDADAFVALTYGKKIEKVVFRHSPGGSWAAGQRIGNLLLGRHITTVVEGLCASACAMAFLGGDQRLLSSAMPRSFLVFHAPFLEGGNAPVETLEYAYFNWIETRTKKVLDSNFIKAINAVKNTQGAVIFRSELDPEVIKSGGKTLLCQGDESDLPWGCPKTDDFGAKSMGMLTE